jgi:hypothetical protein
MSVPKPSNVSLLLQLNKTKVSMKIKCSLFIVLSLFCTMTAWIGKAVASANQATTASYPKSNLKPSAETKSGSSQKTKMMGALNCESVNKLFGNPPIKNRELLGLNRIFYTDQNHKFIDVYCDSKPYGKDKNLWVVALVRDINHTRSDKEGEGQVTYGICQATCRVIFSKSSENGMRPANHM